MGPGRSGGSAEVKRSLAQSLLKEPRQQAGVLFYCTSPSRLMVCRPVVGLLEVFIRCRILPQRIMEQNRLLARVGTVPFLAFDFAPSRVARNNGAGACQSEPRSRFNRYLAHRGRFSGPRLSSLVTLNRRAQPACPRPSPPSCGRMCAYTPRALSKPYLYIGEVPTNTPQRSGCALGTCLASPGAKCVVECRARSGGVPSSSLSAEAGWYSCQTSRTIVQSQG